jgi:dimethylaniline monooxygenase (N-oxide forming)
MPTDLDTSRAHHCLPKGLDGGPLSFALRLKRRLEYHSIRSSEDRAIQAHADALNACSSVAALGPFRRTATKNCSFLRAHLEGKTDLKPGIVELQGDQVRYADGTTSHADIIVCCTGYRQRFAFLPESVTQHVSSSSDLYDYVFVPGMERKLAFIGFVRPAVGTVPAAAELQSRYLALVLDGSVLLPGHDAMAHAIRKQKALAQTTFPEDVERIGHLIDYYPYLSGIARKIGVFPQLRSLFFRDIRLWYKVHFAFLCPGIFRLHGPGAKPHRVTPVLKALPTMKRRVLLVEALLYVACWTLSRLGLRHLRPSP